MVVCESCHKQFLRKHKIQKLQAPIDNMLQNFQEMKVDMSLEIHMMHSYLNFSTGNMGAISDGDGERFHQDNREEVRG